MKCQCSICQELFENCDDNVISALDCGHTFHNACLNQWLENGRTCPSCRNQINRKRIIQRLYFDQPEDAEETVDSDKLQNDIDRLRLEVRKKEKERKDALSSKAELENRIATLEKTKSKLEKTVKDEQNVNSGHLRSLKYFESQQTSLEQEKQECRKIKQKLVNLQRLETLMNGCESEASDIISSTGEGSGAIQNLSRQVAFLKREYEKQKLERRQMKDQFEKLKHQLQKAQMSDSQKTKLVSELQQKNTSLQESLTRTEGDLTFVEREKSILEKKNAKLKRVLQSPGAGVRSSSFTQILNESAEMQKFKENLHSTPKLFKGGNNDEAVDLDITPDLFDSPPSEHTQTQSTSHSPERSNNTVRKSVKRSCENDNPSESGATKYLKITSAAEKSQLTLKKYKSESSVGESNSIKAIASMNIFKKRGLGDSNHGSSIVRKGYDGLGGHTTHINGLGNPFKKPVIKKTVGRKPSKMPSLPKLDGFITID